jgi:hypothetical protein
VFYLKEKRKKKHKNIIKISKYISQFYVTKEDLDQILVKFAKEMRQWV